MSRWTQDENHPELSLVLTEKNQNRSTVAAASVRPLGQVSSQGHQRERISAVSEGFCWLKSSIDDPGH